MPPKLKRQYSSKHIEVACRIKNGVQRAYGGEVAVIIGIAYWGRPEITYLVNDNIEEIKFDRSNQTPEEALAFHLPNTMAVSIVDRECTSACVVSDGKEVTDRRLYSVVREVFI